MKDNIDELKCLLQSYDRKNAYKAAVIALVCAIAAIAAIAAIVYFVRGGCFCNDEFCEFEDDFDDENDDDDFEDE